MPYPESCPECGGVFRNTGTHFTARRNEVGRHVLLELGCQNTTRRFWWDFTTGSLTADGQITSARRPHLASDASASNGSVHPQTNGHAALSTLDLPATLDSGDVGAPLTPAAPQPELELVSAAAAAFGSESEAELDAEVGLAMEVAVELDTEPPTQVVEDVLSAVELEPAEPCLVELPGPLPNVPVPIKEAFVRQLQLDRLTLRQMRSWLMSDEARRAIEVAAGATEATYERLALILFGADLPQLLGRQPASPAGAGMSAEERLEQQREKARIRARLRRAAAKAARDQP